MNFSGVTHYFYMRDVWVSTGDTPTVFRYIDWLITVPLLMIEFFLILSAVTKVPAGVFWRLMIGTLVMLVGGYVGEAGYMAALPAFVIGMVGWAYILYEIFMGQARSTPKKRPSLFNLLSKPCV
jgi:bacteriorhodopsin